MTEPQSINETESFFVELRKEGKATTLNEDKHLRALEEVNTTMEEAHRLFHELDGQSQISAAGCLLTT